MSIAIMGCQIGGMIDDSHMDYTRSLKINRIVLLFVSCLMYLQTYQTEKKSWQICK